MKVRRSGFARTDAATLPFCWRRMRLFWRACRGDSPLPRVRFEGLPPERRGGLLRPAIHDRRLNPARIAGRSSRLLAVRLAQKEKRRSGVSRTGAFQTDTGKSVGCLTHSRPDGMGEFGRMGAAASLKIAGAFYKCGFSVLVFLVVAFAWRGELFLPMGFAGVTNRSRSGLVKGHPARDAASASKPIESGSRVQHGRADQVIPPTL